MKKIIVFEGIAGAGKTTNIKILEGQNYNVEFMNLKIKKVLGEINKLYSINFENSEYFKLFDILKCTIYKELDKSIIVERNYISTLAHAYALEKLKIEKGAYSKMYKWYKKNINKSLIQPDIYVFFDVPINISIERIKQRNEKVVNEIWKDEDYLKICNKFKKEFLKKNEKNQKFII